jgi:site-specific DNA-methyltransferase (adenine-specific)
MIELFNIDCMIKMAEYPDKYFDLAIVDPEFGIGIGRSARLVTDRGLSAKAWDDKPIDANYFIELFRVSKHQIIWGGNYYNIGITKHCIVWDKKQPEGMSFGMFDFAWTSFDTANKMFRYSVQNETNKIHPTQKPIALYEWLLKHYAKEGDRILDTHGGSMSSVIAAYDFGITEMVCCEIDKDYFEAGKKRFEIHKQQQKLF